MHWRDLPGEGSRLILNPLDCLRDATHCLTGIELTVAADSVLHNHPRYRARWPEFCAEVPGVHRRAFGDADGVCESGIETLTWQRIRHLPVGIARQVSVPGVGSVDFVLGERLVVEVDGEAFHAGAAEFEHDRARDAQLALWGFVVLRFSYRQVTERWAEVDAAIRAALAAGWHLRR